jgi:hypothetical protein
MDLIVEQKDALMTVIITGYAILLHLNVFVKKALQEKNALKISVEMIVLAEDKEYVMMVNVFV